MNVIDLNADLAEGSLWDAELLGIVTSANICCGAHAGSPDTIHHALAIAAQNGVTIGAHPGYADRANFGRVEQALPAAMVEQQLLEQLSHLVERANAIGCAVRYVKPHGALYNQAMRNADLAGIVRSVANRFGLPVVGLPGSPFATDGGAFIAEGFADRRYLPNGALVPRSQADAMIDDPAEAVAQANMLIPRDHIRTLCVHGDQPAAVAFAHALRASLLATGYRLAAFA